jgi:hypothetical protein
MLVAITVLEYLPPKRAWRETLPTAAHVWLATQSEARVLDCVSPSPGATAGLTMLTHHSFGFLVEPFLDCAEPTLGDKLAAFRFTHVVVRSEEAMWPWIAAGGTPDGTRPAGRFDDSAVFEVTERTPRVYVRDVAGFFPREFGQDRSWRWMADRGALTVLNMGHESFIAMFEVELSSFATSRIVEIALDDRHVTCLMVVPDLRWYGVGPIEIAAGSHTISFQSDATAVTTVTPGARDDRRLSIRVGRWRWKAFG